MAGSSDPDLVIIEPSTGRVLVPLSSLGDAYREVGRLEAQVDALRGKLLDAEMALRDEREKPCWWWPALRKKFK